MPQASLHRQADQVVETLRDLRRFKPYLKAVLPEDLSRLKDHLAELHPEGGEKRAADYDLFYAIGVVLSGHSEPLTMGELSRALDVPLSTATRMVDWLVRNGYAERLADLKDRRIVRVALTENGRTLYRTIDEFIRLRVERVLRRFTPKGRNDLLILLRKLMATIKETFGEDKQ